MDIIIDLAKYLGILFIGGIIGARGLMKGKVERNLDIIQELCLLFLLFVMGLMIGLNDEVINNLFSIGVNAFVISIFTIIFSILAVRLIKNIVLKRGNEDES